MTMSRHNAILAASLLAFAGALAGDGFYIDGPNPRAWANGAGLLAFGWFGLFDGTYAWLANPALLAAWMLFHTSRAAWSAFAAALALALMLSFLAATSIITNEAGGRAAITAHGLGYWSWLASAAIMLAGAVLVRARA